MCAPRRPALRSLLLLATWLTAGIAGLAGPAAASHFATYANTPLHDDLGRSSEPDGHITWMLGAGLVEERIADVDLDGRAEPVWAIPAVPGQSRHLAPGCTDDQGRQPAGMCWLYLSTAGDGYGFGIPGMEGDRAPGRFTPTKGTAVRFLDLQWLQDAPPLAGSKYLPTGAKLADAGVAGYLRGLDAGWGGPYAPAGPTGLMAWYGQWTDRNGNGVIDHTSDAVNEFTWLGDCLRFGGGPSEVPAEVCRPEPRSAEFPEWRHELPLWVFPGNHHARCGGFQPLGSGSLCGATPADAPGRQALCTVAIGADHGSGVARTFDCPRRLADLDRDDEARYADPLLGRGGAPGPDLAMTDRAGDADPTVRMWVADAGWPAWTYDAGLWTTTVMVAALDPPWILPRLAALDHAAFLDVDRVTALSPGAEAVVQGQVRPAAAGAWALLRPLAGGSVAAATATPTGPVDGSGATRPLGHGDDALADPGWAREPNHPRDAYPGAVHLAHPADPEDDPAAVHRGWRNDMSGYRERPRAWMDARAERLLALAPTLEAPVVGCALCASGPGATTGLGSKGGLPGDAQDHRRWLAPGGWVGTGRVGLWHDRPATLAPEVLALLPPGGDPGAPAYVAAHGVPADGWVGSVVERTGAFRYRGYGLEVCRIEGAAAAREWAECHPDLDGRLPDGHDPDGPHGAAEFTGRCPDGGAAVVWDPGAAGWWYPVFVLAEYAGPANGLGQRIIDRTHTPWPIAMGLSCGQGTLVTQAMLLLPLGAGGVVETTVEAQVAGERVLDVDRYDPPGDLP